LQSQIRQWERRLHLKHELRLTDMYPVLPVGKEEKPGDE
jgi:hypothetical protein